MIDFEGVWRKYRIGLKNLTIPRPKYRIAFSGPVGSGKTTMAKLIEERTGGIRVSNDEIRELLLEMGVSLDDLEVNLKEFLVFMLKKLVNLPNRLMVMDISIDRSYDNVKKWVVENGYKLVVIRLKIDKGVWESRLKAREAANPKIYHMDYEINWNDYVKFGKTGKYDIEVDVNGDIQMEELFRLLGHTIDADY